MWASAQRREPISTCVRRQLTLQAAPPALVIAATAAKESTAIGRSARSFRLSAQARGRQQTLVNLPGWCWAEIQQFALVGSSSSLHSEACNALGASDGVIHSRISQEVVCLRATTNTSLCDNDFRPFHVKHARCRKIVLRLFRCLCLAVPWANAACHRLNCHLGTIRQATVLAQDLC